MGLFALMRMFTIRVRMLGAIAVVLVLLGLLGGAGMFGMFRIYDLNQSFLNGPFQQAGLVAKLQGSLTQVRNLEKEMIIQYEQPEQLKKTHAEWTTSLQAVQAAGLGGGRGRQGDPQEAGDHEREAHRVEHEHP